MPDDQPLVLYVDYEPYLTARQLGELLESLNSLYQILRFAPAPELRGLPRPPDTDLRILTLTTGNSVTIGLVEGVAQVVRTMDPAVTATITGVPALAALGALVYRIADKAEQIANRAITNKIERDKSRAEVAARRAEIEHRRHEIAREEFVVALQDAAALTRSQVPAVTPARDVSPDYRAMATEAMPALIQLLGVLEATNIRQVLDDREPR